MPHTLSAKKRLRQADKRRIYNKSLRTEIKTCVRKLDAAVAEKDKAAAESTLRLVIEKLDKSVKKGVYHKNTAARKKSHCAKLLHQLAG